MESSFRIGDWLVEPLQNRLVRGDTRVKLDPKVMQVLLYLAERPNEVAEKEKILASVWDGTFVTDEVLTNAIFELRKALGDDAKEPRFVQTVPRKGYRLIAPLEGAPGVSPGRSKTWATVALGGDVQSVLPRLQRIGDELIGIEEALAEPKAASVGTRGRRGLVVAAILAAALAGGIAFWSWMRRAGSPLEIPSSFDIILPPEQALTHLNDPVVAWSPDGTRLVHVGGTSPQKLYLRPIDGVTSTPIPGTEGFTAFFSPDGDWVGFYVDGLLKKVQPEKGSAIALCAAPDPWGGSWGDDDTILFAPTETSGLVRVSAAGGECSPVTTPDPSRAEIAHRFPEFLPGAKAALFTIWTGPSQSPRIAVLRLGTGEHSVLVEGASFARYASTGHLVYARQGALEAAPFDLETLEVTGPPVALGLTVRNVGTFGTAHFSLSRGGSLAYIPAGGPTEKTLVWVDRAGWTRPLTERRGGSDNPRLSPDGKRIAMAVADDGGSHVWIYDLERDAYTRLSGADGDKPIWTPDGEKVTFLSRSAIVWQAADGSGAVETLTTLSSTNSDPSSWFPDGELLAYGTADPETGLDVWLLSMDGARNTRPFLQTPAHEAGGIFSPDGRWIAYDSNESGRMEVYVQPFPGPGGRWQVSTEGGVQAVWARSGKEIFYRNGDKMMVVQVETEPSIQLSKPEVLFEGRYEGATRWAGYAKYDVTPDGQRFLMVRSEEALAPTRIHVVLNWAEELRKKVPSAPR